MIELKKLILLLPLVAALVFGFGLKLTQAQSDAELPEQIELASAKLEDLEPLAPVISMDFQDANLKDILKVFSQQAQLNFVASENIKDRKVTLYLDKVSVEDALNTIMTANNLTYEQDRDSSIFIVKEWGRPEVETTTKIFPLQYARVKGYELTTSESTTSKTSLKEVIEKLLSTHGKIVEDSRTNSLIVVDVPTQFEVIERAIEELDIKLPQVMIEAEVIETTVNALEKLGIQWGTSADGNLVSAFGSARSAMFPFTKPQGMGKVGADGAPVSLYTGYISANNLGGTLSMLKSDSNTRILARPKILTLNNEAAEIKITSETAVASLTQTVSGEGTATTTTSAERVETGISLKVTPQINKKGEITMGIEPSVISTTASTFFSEFVDPQTRSAKTTVTIPSEQTIVIGGLINTEETKTLRKVPWFGDVPILGNLFRKKNDTGVDKELIIFITPHLISEGTQGEKGLVLEKQVPWEYSDFGLKEEAMDRILDRFEE